MFIVLFIDPPFDTIQSQMKPIHILPYYFFKIHFNIIFPSIPKSPK
jgi:hypothetical protein